MQISATIVNFQSFDFPIVNCTFLNRKFFLGVPLGNTRVGLSARHPQSHHLRPQRTSKLTKAVALWLTESASIPHAARPEPVVGSSIGIVFHNFLYLMH